MENDIKKYYVYQHINKETLTPFHVGKGSGDRFKSSSARSEEWHLIADKKGWFGEIIAFCENEDEAFCFENFFIKYYKQFNWCESNKSLGKGILGLPAWNNGKSSWAKGFHFTDVHKQKISQSLIGKPAPIGINSPAYIFLDNEEIIWLYIFEKLSTNKIAQKCNVSYGTIWHRLIELNIIRRKPGQEPKPIICLNDNQIFDSISDAAKVYGVFRENIRKVLKGKYQHTNNLQFAYYNPQK